MALRWLEERNRRAAEIRHTREMARLQSDLRLRELRLQQDMQRRQAERAAELARQKEARDRAEARRAERVKLAQAEHLAWQAAFRQRQYRSGW